MILPKKQKKNLGAKDAYGKRYVSFLFYPETLPGSAGSLLQGSSPQERKRGLVIMEKNMKKKGSCLIVYVPRELDHHFAQQVTKEVDTELLRGTVRQLVFDFSDTTFMDSSGIGMLMGRKRLLSYSGGTVSVIHVNDRLKKIMELSGISRYVEISQESVWNKIRR